MERLKYRAVIEFLVLEGRNGKEIDERLRAVYGTSAPSTATVYNWVREVKNGRQSLEDDPRTGGPRTAVTEAKVAAVLAMVKEDRQITIAQLAESLGISDGSVHTILHDHLLMSKVTTKWVPKTLSALQRDERVTCSTSLLNLMQANEELFLHRLVTGDETWVHHYDPETQAEARVWMGHGDSVPERPRMSRSAGKVMMTIFWDVNGPLLIDFLPHKMTVTGEYYAELLARLRCAIKAERRGKLTSGVLLLHDNAPVHRSRVATAALRDCGFEQLDHPAYSPDLSPCDYFLFSNLKRDLRGRRFSSDQELVSTVTHWFNTKPATFYRAGIMRLRERYARCIAREGAYVE